MSKNLEGRTYERIREHYDIEKRLASRLMNSTGEERLSLYRTLYDELFQLVPDHPQIAKKNSKEQTSKRVAQGLRFIKRFIQGVDCFMEVGPGDCALAIKVAEIVPHVYAVDVSSEISKGVIFPRNFTLCISDGCTIPVPDNSVDLAYSDQLMEHLHPDDAYAQLKNIYAALKKDKGRYVCITPHRYTGPRDISRFFDDVATGFHLKEYTISELLHMFREVGFKKVYIYSGGKGLYLRGPLTFALSLERLLGKVPLRLRKRLARFYLSKALLGIYVVGEK